MFASIYDILMEDVDYKALLEQFKPYLNKNKTILDAGCGTGYFLKELLEQGYDAIGLDKDSDMLKIARDKLLNLDLPQPLYEHDLRKPLNAQFDLIFCLFDVINYFKGAKTVFNHMYQALNENGVFIFDVYHKDQIKQYHLYEESDIDPIEYHWKMTYHEPILSHTITVNKIAYQMKQYVYDQTYYTELLTALKFKNIQFYQGIDPRKIVIVAYK